MCNSVLGWLINMSQNRPEAAAYFDEEISYSFGEVLEATLSIGSALLEKVCTKANVAIMCKRGAFTPIVCLGVLAAGGVYVPVDCDEPEERIRCKLSDIDVPLIIADGKNYEKALSIAEKSGDMTVLRAEELLRTEIDKDIYNRVDYSAKEPAFVCFTSGSTGRPKAVYITHGGLTNYIQGVSEVFDIGKGDVLGCQAPLDYIAAIREIYLPLLKGAASYIIPRYCFSMPARLSEVLKSAGVNVLFWSTAFITMLDSFGVLETGCYDNIRLLCFTGSAMPGRILRKLQEHTGIERIFNQYGSTEVTGSCTYYEVTHKVECDEVLPIGVPYPGYDVYLEEETKEIVVSGIGVAAGFGGVFRTGDIGRMRADGLIEFAGRRDRMIKYLGRRVEPEEIECAARNISGVDDCVVIYSEEKNELRLIFEGRCETSVISNELRKVLPGYMIPRRVINGSIKRLGNGKPDINSMMKG